MPVFFSLLYRNTSVTYCIVAKWQSEWVPEGIKNTLSPANALSLVRSFPTDISLSPSGEQLLINRVAAWLWLQFSEGSWDGSVRPGLEDFPSTSICGQAQGNTSWQVRLRWSCAAAGRPPGHCLVSWRKASYWASLAGSEAPFGVLELRTPLASVPHTSVLK